VNPPWTDQQLDAALADMRSTPRRPPEWRLSAKGNLWRRHGPFTLTVFTRRDGLFGWCVAGGKKDPPRFSPGGYQSPGEAVYVVTAEANRLLDERRGRGRRRAGV
jgi:hypothetical protein